MQTYQTTKPTENNALSSHKLTKLILLLILLALGIAYRFSSTGHQETLVQINNNTPIVRYALIGDIGGTNIRYQLVSFLLEDKLPLEVIKQQRMKVKDYQTFESSVTEFLEGITRENNYPDVIVIAMAGPIQQNTVSLPNVPKWGRLNGTQLTQKYNVSQFLFINDFEAVSYGLLIVDDSQFVQLNGKQIDGLRTRGVIGPGTGLGHSVIFNNKNVEDGIIVLPSQAGHSDVPYIDAQAVEYVEFLKQKLGQDYIDSERAFCGPSLPYMLEFYIQKMNETLLNIENVTPQDIVQECTKDNPIKVYEKVFQMFMKFYSSAIANFMVQHMTTGGVYLVGGLTKALLSKIKGTDILKAWKLRHPEMKKLIQQIPLVFCNEIDLGLRGAFVVAKRSARKYSSTKVISKGIEEIF